jgi:hypothetical protein
MSAKKYRFVSPGVFLSEIDQSQLPKQPNPVGPVVIGRAQRGPGMRPVTVNSFLDFVEVFGNPIPGGEGGDVWRDGNRTSPTYASYAARAWLKNGSPVTIVRVLGEANSAATNDGAAGWSTVKTTPSVGLSDNGGAFGLFVAPSASAGVSLTGTLAAVFYLNSGSIRLAGENTAGATTTDGAAELIISNGADYGFKAIIENSTGTAQVTSSFNFNKDSDLYIRKVFNTDPTLMSANTEEAAHRATYFLGETFERNLFDTLGTASGSSGSAFAFVAGLTSGADRKRSAQAASTGMVISQKPSPSSSVENLFSFTALDSGEWANSNLKISISDIAAPTNPDFDPYGTFTVEVRDARDSDAKKQVLETFTGCNLNPNSPNFVAVKIGDKYTTWSDTERRFTEYGDYNNSSKYIYVSMDSPKDPSLVPFGFIGPNTFADATGSLNDDETDTTILAVDIPHTASDGISAISASAARTNDNITCTGPQIALRLSSSTGGFTDPTAAYWGITTSQRDNSNFERSYIDLTRYMAPSIDTTTSFTFSLENIAMLSSSEGGIENVAVYGASDDTGATIADGGPSVANPTGASASYALTLDAGFDRFTMPLVGGFDGFDITDKDPIRNTKTDTGTEYTNYAVNSLKRAIDTVADPEVVDMNLAVIPGVTTPSITSHLIDTCENRADSLAIIDLQGGYESDSEGKKAPADRVGSVSETVRDLKARALNSSYACSYYPWVQTKDELGTGKILWVPPSVAALGTFASNDKKSAPWFAPAGFTRGGLSDGAAGIPVIGVREHLTRKMRDKLYENNVNPIAKFPAEGIVIFGQKTLQATPSALDRVNVRRMMLYVKKGISNISSTLLFDSNTRTTWNRFLAQAEPFLRDVQAQLGLTDYKIVLDETTTTPDLVDRNVMYAKIFLKPARSIEFIAIDFIITRTGASFDD